MNKLQVSNISVSIAELSFHQMFDCRYRSIYVRYALCSVLSNAAVF